MIIDKPLIAAAVKPDKKVPAKSYKKGDPWFCKDYNSEEGCLLESGHIVATPKGDQKPALHICARCWRTKKWKKDHSEKSNDCPTKL